MLEVFIQSLKLDNMQTIKEEQDKIINGYNKLQEKTKSILAAWNSGSMSINDFQNGLLEVEAEHQRLEKANQNLEQRFEVLIVEDCDRS